MHLRALIVHINRNWMEINVVGVGISSGMKIVQNSSVSLTAAADYQAFRVELLVTGSCIQPEQDIWSNYFT